MTQVDTNLEKKLIFLVTFVIFLSFFLVLISGTSARFVSFPIDLRGPFTTLNGVMIPLLKQWHRYW